MQMDTEEKEISLLDMLLVVAENLKLLIFGPVLVGLLALAIAYVVPQSYTSQAILALPAPATVTMPTPTQAAAMMASPVVLDPVVVALQLSAGRPIEEARKELLREIKVTVGKDGLLRLDVSANTPQEAQARASAIIGSWLKSTVPGEQDRADLEQRLAYARGALAAVNRLLERLTAEGAANLNQPLTRGEAGTSLVAVGELQARYFAEVQTIPRTLQGLTTDVVKQPPTLPTEPVAPKKSLMAVLAALGSGFALLLWVFMRQAWKSAAQDPQAAPKLARLRAVLGLKDRQH